MILAAKIANFAESWCLFSTFYCIMKRSCKKILAFLGWKQKKSYLCLSLEQ